MPKLFFTATACIESLAGLSFLFLPGLTAWLVCGVKLDSAALEMICRMTGAALLSLGIACHLARQDVTSPAARALTTGMLLYNFLVIVIFVSAATAGGVFGIALWPVVVLHAFMTYWSQLSLRHGKSPSAG